MNLEQANKEFDKQYNLAMDKYGYVEYDFLSKDFQAVTRALCDVHRYIVEGMVEEKLVKQPTHVELTRCLYDMLYFTVKGFVAKDAGKYSKRVLAILNEQSITYH